MKYSDFSPKNEFISRHIGPQDPDIQEMLGTLGFSSLEEMAKKVFPSQILSKHNFQELGEGISEFDLLKIEFKWRRQQNCEADFHHEDFKILKPLVPRDHGHLHRLLKEKIGTKLASGSFLESIQVHHLGGRYSVEV